MFVKMCLVVLLELIVATDDLHVVWQRNSVKLLLGPSDHSSYCACIAGVHAESSWSDTETGAAVEHIRLDCT